MCRRIFYLALLSIWVVSPFQAGESVDGKPTRPAVAQGGQFDHFHHYWYQAGLPCDADTAEAVHWLRLVTVEGGDVALFKLGWLYDRGQGVPRNRAAALALFRMAATKGNADALCRLAMESLHQAEKSTQERRAAVVMLRDAAERGQQEAQYELGLLYQRHALPEEELNSTTLKQDLVEGARWIRKAAEQGHYQARRTMVWICKNGAGVAPDEQEAYQWKMLAMGQDGSFDLSGESGSGEPSIFDQYLCTQGKDSAQDFAWLDRAAQKGQPEAQMMLGLSWYTGSGHARSQSKAAHWLLRAARQGEANACYILGCFYHDGQGVQKSNRQAYFWLLLSDRQGFPGAGPYVLAAAALLSPSQRKSIQELVLRCVFTNDAGAVNAK